MSKLVPSIVVLLAAGMCAAGETIGLAVNIDGRKAAALSKGAMAAGVTLDFGGRADFAHLPDVLVWQSDDGGRKLSQQDVDRIAEHLAGGHALLLTVTMRPGTDAFRLTPVSPTTAWQTMLPLITRGLAAPDVAACGADREFFSSDMSFRVPYRYRMRPMHAAELGETRYEKIERRMPFIDLPRKAGETFIKRPLVNGGWKTRLYTDSEARESLLMTGRYGAGRVAVFASTAEAGTEAFWKDVFSYLARRDATASAAKLPPAAAVEFAPDAPGRRIVVRASNPTGAALDLPVRARLSSWNGEYLEDVEARLKLPAGGSGEVAVALPEHGSLRAQSLDYFRAYSARVAVLSPDGARVVREEELYLDCSPTVEVRLLAPELGSAPNPLPGPEPFWLKLPERGGAHVGEYVYRPGEKRTFTVVVENGRKNLAPFAKVVAPDAPDPGAAYLLNNHACSQMAPREHIVHAGFCAGNAGKDTTFVFAFDGVTELNGAEILCTRTEKERQLTSPGSATLVADGRPVAEFADLDALFLKRPGFASVKWPRTTAKEWKFVFHWVASAPKGMERIPPRFGEIRLLGPVARATDLKLDLGAVLRPFGGAERRLPLKVRETVAAGEELVKEFELEMPALRKGEKVGLGRIDLVSGEKTVAAVPYLVSAGEEGSYLLSRSLAMPRDRTMAVGHTVTRGFRNWAPDGAGTRDAPGAWHTPEDLVFSFSRRLNQTSVNGYADPAKFFLTDQGVTHRCTAWGHTLSGERFMAAAQPEFMGKLTNSPAWKKNDVVSYAFSDRWDTGPAMNMLFGWQELVEFDRHLRRSGREGLRGRTLGEFKGDASKRLKHEFHAWQFQEYLANFRQLRDQLEKNGKRMAHSGQGTPLVPPQYVPEFAAVFRGMSDDDTWGAMEEDMPLTTARQMALKAYNPMWRLNYNFVWGWDNCVYVNTHWWMPVGVTETSRRHTATRGWRMAVENDGRCASIHSYGYGMNGYSSPVQDANDWQQNWYWAERINRIRPDGPIGMGLCVGAGVLTDEENFIFSGGGMGGNALADTLIGRTFRIVGEMHHRRVGVPFSANATALAKSNLREPLLIPLPGTFSAKERGFVANWAKTRGKIVLVSDGAPLAPEFAALFADAKPVPGTDAVSQSKAGVLVDRPLEKVTQADYDAVARIVREDFDLGVVFPEGVSGYGFTSCGRRFVAIEDLREEGREVTVKVRAGAGASAVAMELNTHRMLDARRDGRYWSVTFPLKKADGNLIAIEER